MISKLHLENVKTHKDTVLEFSPGVNVITGNSGQGKTNILLASSWVKDNRPLGTGCIRRGQESATTTMEVIDGEDTWSIIRKRSQSENTYGVEKNNIPVGKPLTAFGQSTPKIVSDILNLSDINIQKQRDSHFLVYSPPGQIATFIRSITKLDEIDQVTKLLSGKIRKENTELTYLQGELESTNKELAVLNKVDLVSLENMIDEAKNRILMIEEIKRKTVQIESIVDALKALERNRIVLPDNLDQLFEDVEERIKIGVGISERMGNLRILVDKIRELEAGRIILPKDLEILSIVESVIEKYIDTNAKIETLCALLEEICIVTLKIENGDTRLARLECEEKELVEKLDICPHCGVELTEELKRVLLER